MNYLNEKLSGLKTILHKAQEYCAYRERCRFEVAQKLQQWGVDKPRAAKIIEQLEKNNFINEERFAEIFIRSKFRLKNWGKKKIMAELRMKKIPESIISKYLQTIDTKDYYSAIQSLIEKKSKELKEKDTFKKNQKIARFLIAKGFEPQQVFSALQISDF